MKKMINILILCLLAFLSAPGRAFSIDNQEGWLSVKKDISINTKSIARVDDNIVSVWVKMAFDKSSDAFSRTQRYLRKKFGDYRSYSYTGYLFEIDCRNKRLRAISRIFYNAGKNIIFSANDSWASWADISPESSHELVHGFVCGREIRSEREEAVF